ncbi:MAG: EpsI family protein [Candidatus Omnitrophica bacterium]|nr:EpsI family protein [Candidatus Omnitrophota bacterium]
MKRYANLGYVFVLILFAATAVLSFSLFFQKRSSRDLLDIRSFPARIGTWVDRDIPISEGEYRILETRNAVTREYEDPSLGKLVLFIIYSDTNRSVFHPPDLCLVGGGFSVVDKTRELVTSAGRSFYANRMLMRKGDYKLVVLFCYKAGDLYFDSYYLQQAYIALHQLFGRRFSGATIRVTMPVVSDERSTLAIAKDFLGQVAAALNSLTSQ